MLILYLTQSERVWEDIHQSFQVTLALLKYVYKDKNLKT